MSEAIVTTPAVRKPAKMSDFPDVTRDMIIKAARSGVNMTNEQHDDYEDEDLRKLFTIDGVYDNALIALALLIDPEDGSGEQVPQRMREALRDAILTHVRFTI